MTTRIPSKKIQRLSEILISLNQQEIDQFVYLFKDRITAKPKNCNKKNVEIYGTPVHTKRFPHPVSFSYINNNLILNFYNSLFQTLRTTCALTKLIRNKS